MQVQSPCAWSDAGTGTATLKTHTPADAIKRDMQDAVYDQVFGGKPLNRV